MPPHMFLEPVPRLAIEISVQGTYWLTSTYNSSVRGPNAPSASVVIALECKHIIKNKIMF